jgi:hypothetical protein
VKITYDVTLGAWTVVNDVFVWGPTPKAVEQAVDLSQGNSPSITSDADFVSAIDRLPGSQTLLYVDVSGTLTAAQPILEGNGAYQEFLDAGGKDLVPIKAVVAGGGSTETASTYRAFIEIP